MAELLSSKSEELSGKRGQRIGGSVQFTSADAASFWLRHTVNSHLPLLADQCRSPHIHPEAVYGVLASLVGALCTYSPDKSPTSVPPYDHGNLTATFLERQAPPRTAAEHRPGDVRRHPPSASHPTSGWA